MRRARLWRGRCVAVRLLALLVLAGLAAGLSGCNEDDIERELGSMSARSVESSYRVVRDPLLNEWIDNMGQTMVAYCTRQQIPYQFKIIDTDVVNAFAAPYGHIYVTTGLIEFAEDEDEVWGVVGHEIGHVVRRHSIKSVKEGFLFNLATVLIGSKNETFGDIAGLGLGLLSLRHSRKDEYQADDQGTRLAYLAGHDPRGNTDFFARLFDEMEHRHRASYLEVMFRTHPPTERRITRQMAHPELDETNVDALLRTARGYMQRGRYAVAFEHLDKALSAAPDSPQILTVLGDALAARGEWESAAKCYEHALQSWPADPYVQQQLAMAEPEHPDQTLAMTPAEQDAARNTLTRAELLALRASSTRIEMQSISQQIDSRTRTLAKSATDVNDSLMDLGTSSTELSSGAQQAMLAVNGAVAKASDSVYSLERLGKVLDEAGAEVRSLTQQGLAALQAASEGNAQAGEVAIATRSLVEIEAALNELQSASEGAGASLSEVERAQRSAQSTLEDATRLMRFAREVDATRRAYWAAKAEVAKAKDRPDSDALARAKRRMESARWELMMAEMQESNYISRVNDSARVTDRHGTTAWEKVDSARQTAHNAQVRLTVARLNLMALAQSSAMRQALDKLVAYYTMATPRQAAELRETGLGVGDAAVVLAASKSSGIAPLTLAGTPSPTRSIVDAISRPGESLMGPRLLLRFLSAAMTQEVELQTEG